MLFLVMVQELFGAGTTWLVIRIARDITEAQVTASDFVWIVVTQTFAYLAGAVSWIYAERTGFAPARHHKEIPHVHTFWHDRRNGHPDC